MKIKQISFTPQLKVEWLSGPNETDKEAICSSELPLESFPAALATLIVKVIKFMQLPGTQDALKFSNARTAGYFPGISIDKIAVSYPSEVKSYKYKVRIRMSYYAYCNPDLTAYLALPVIMVKPFDQGETAEKLNPDGYADKDLVAALETVFDEGLKYANGERLQGPIPGMTEDAPAAVPAGGDKKGI